LVSGSVLGPSGVVTGPVSPSFIQQKAFFRNCLQNQNRWRGDCYSQWRKANEQQKTQQSLHQNGALHGDGYAAAKLQRERSASAWTANELLKQCQLIKNEFNNIA
jgi:hypothetical protein